ncbi:MAG: hypothetical protein H9W81_01155 [Enterococcus sp.]|nr:hypothetical protein [Enterococcus sp.]
MSTIIADLLAEGMSYTTLAKICDTRVLDIKKARKDDSVLSQQALDKLRRLKRYYTVVHESNQSPVIDPATFFEDHIFVCIDKDNKPCWAYVHELWIHDLMDDDTLAADLWNTNEFYGMDELLKDYPMEFRVETMADGEKSIIADIPLPKADMNNMYPLV